MDRLWLRTRSVPHNFVCLLYTSFAPLAAFAQNAPKMGGGMKGEDTMGGGGMKGDDMARMSQMMTMMREKLSHAGERVASLKTCLLYTSGIVL